MRCTHDTPPRADNRRMTIRSTTRQLRRASTLAEQMLWACLRGRRLRGFKFRRQHPLAPYVVDFCCPAELFSQYRARVLRFTNQQVLESIDLVLETIRRALET